jgi:hypothetical protein
MFSHKDHEQRRWRTRSVMFAAVLFLYASAAYGQAAPKPNTAPPSDPLPNSSKENSDTRFGSPESEMRAKLILKEEKKRYDEHLARAREASKLASQLCESYEARKAFDSEDGKKLERLEKLTRRIRNEAGGSDTESDVRDIPAVLEMAVKRVADLADELQKMVEKTPRNVVSAAVIDQANKLIGLVQHVRDASR